MKEIKDIHLKVDAVMAVFELILDASPFEHFKEFEEEIMKKSKNEEEFLDLNDSLVTILVTSSIKFLYEDVLSKPRYQSLRDQIYVFIDDEIGDPTLASERGCNIQRLFIKHLNKMDAYANNAVDNLANNIKKLIG